MASEPSPTLRTISLHGGHAEVCADASFCLVPTIAARLAAYAQPPDGPGETTWTFAGYLGRPATEDARP